jgi:LacI family transcriptional regulator, galactose operon repressor
MTPRLKDIARDLNLSVVTVSKVLRNHPDISEETRARVLKRVKEVNYHPNLAARALITGQSFTLGLIVPDLLHPFFAQIAQVISSSVRERGYTLIISSSDEDPELEQHEIAHLLSRRVDCLLIASSQWSVESFRQIEMQNIPYILLDRQFDGLATNFVGVDDQAVGLLATRHLLEQGCRRIAHIRGPEVSTARGRYNGYCHALHEAGLVPSPEDVISLGTSGDTRGARGGYEATAKLLANATRPDGIFCFNDPSALGAMRALLDAGLSIPEDVAVIGCGNLSYSDFLRVPLSSIDQGSLEIGTEAARMALLLAGQKNSPRPQTRIIEPRLVARMSSKRDKN